MAESKNPKGAGRKSILTPLEKIAIVAKYAEGTPIYILSYDYKVSERTIRRVLEEHREREKHGE